MAHLYRFHTSGISFFILLFSSSVFSITHRDGDYEGVLTSLLQHFQIRHCLILEEFKLSHDRKYVKSFSKIGVATAVMNIEDFREIVDSPVRTYSNTAVLLYVSRKEDQIAELIENFPLDEILIEDKNIIYIVLVAPGVESFTDYIYVPLYCQFLIIRPIGVNFFNINEYYSIFEFRKESQWGFWSRNNKLSVTVEEPLFRRRQDFEGTTLTAAYQEGSRPGLQYWFWGIFEEFYNFTTRYEIYEEQVRNGRNSDAYLTNIAMHPEQYTSHVVWPLGKSSYYIFMRRPTEDTSFWTNYFRPFTAKAWLVVLLFVLLIWVTILILKITAVQKTKEKFDPVGYGCLPFDTLMNQSGMNVPTMTLSFRIGFFVTICFAALLQCLYGGELISHLTTHEYTLPFTDVTGFVKDGTYNITFPKGKYASQLLLNLLGPVVRNYVSTHYTEFLGYDQVLNQVCYGRVVFAAEKRIIDWYGYWPDDCEIVAIPRPLHTVVAVMLLQSQSHFKSAFQFLLPLLQETGLSMNAHLEYYRKPLNVRGKPALTEINLPRIFPAFTVLFFGTALALIVLALEFLILRCSSYLKKQNKMG